MLIPISVLVYCVAGGIKVCPCIAYHSCDAASILHLASTYRPAACRQRCNTFGAMPEIRCCCCLCSAHSRPKVSSLSQHLLDLGMIAGSIYLQLPAQRHHLCGCGALLCLRVQRQ